MRTLFSASLVSLSIGLLAGAGAGGCGSDVNDAAPRLIPGGGIGDGAILGRLNVTVIDSDTDEPISNARVLVGEPGETPLEGLTDSTGLLVVKDDSLDGPTTVTVAADSYAVATWFGANGANVTIPLDPKAGGVQVPHAALSGTIEGWADLPEPPQNHGFLGVVSYSQTSRLGDPANELAQGGAFQNVCTKLPVIGGECNFTIDSRTGHVAVFAIILDYDSKGTPDQGDDTTAIIGLAYKLGVVVEDGVAQSGLVLTQLEAGAMEDVPVTLATPPSGLTAAGVLGLDLGDDGIMMVGIVDPATGDTAHVPRLAGPFAGKSYRAIAFANAENQANDANGAILHRGITDLGAGVDFGPWLDLPASIDVTAGEYSFTPTGGAAVHIGEVRDAEGNALWNAALLDGRTSFTLPGLSPDPLPAGELVFQVSALDGDVDLQDFSVDGLLDVVDRIAANSTSFTR